MTDTATRSHHSTSAHPRWSILSSSLAINILSLALPIMTLQVYDRVLPFQSSDTLYVLTFGVCVALFLETMLKLARSYMTEWAGATYEHRASCELMAHLLVADLNYLRRDGLGADLQKMSAVSRLKSFYNGEILTVYIDVLFVLAFLGLIAFIGGALVLVPLVILCVFALLSMRFADALKEGLLARQEADHQRYNFLIQSLNAIHTIKSFGLESIFQRRYEYMEKNSSLPNLNVSRISAAAFNNSVVFSHLIVVSVISWGAFKVIHNEMSMGALVACILLSGRIMQPVQKMLQLLVKSKDYEIAKQDVMDVLNCPIHILQHESQETRPIESMHATQVRFIAYVDDETIIKEATLHLNRGDTVTVGGKEGSGKSTLLKVLAGIYKASDGRLWVNEDMAYPLPSFYAAQHIGMVSNTVTLFRGTIRNNLTHFGQIPEQKALEIAQALDLHREIKRLPSGLDTFMDGNDTDSVSPGLKQRIALVANLAMEPTLLLFDNADEGLDNSAQKALYHYLKKIRPQCIMVIVSQNPLFNGLANRHFILHGKVLHEVKETRAKGAQA